jgi:arginine N-succinyltransferase
MLFVRPAATSDHKEILALAKEAGIGMTSLPANAEVLEEKIVRSVSSFSGRSDTLGEECFLFVLEDTEKQKLVGTTGLVAHVGVRNPFYSYKLSTIVQASTEVDIYSTQRVLHMVNDYTGASEVGSLFLCEDYRRDGIGKFLSRCRYLMLAQFPQLFSDTVISEIRGVQDADGESPFYTNLAQHFFQMPFKKADFVNATEGSQFISDLMPKYPIYVNLLHAEAQAVIGQPLEASKAAKHMLEQEGFRHQGYVDVFDAGPTMQAERESIRTVRKSRMQNVIEIREVATKFKHMVSNRSLKDFRVVLAGVEESDDGVILNAETARILGVKKGEPVRLIEA